MAQDQRELKAAVRGASDRAVTPLRENQIGIPAETVLSRISL
jgi:hypothetical protein